MKCPLCQKEIPTEGVSEDRVNNCVFCGSPLLKMNEKMTALADYLTKKNIISSADDLKKTVSVTFRYVSDDGIIPMKQFERPLICPLFYTADDVLKALVRENMLFGKRFHYLTDFYSYSSDLTVNHRDDPLQRPKDCDVILAEALTAAKNNCLTLVYGHRDEMMSRMGPDVCMYGCPASSEIEEKYMNIVHRTELVPLDE